MSSRRSTILFLLTLSPRVVAPLRDLRARPVLLALLGVAAVLTIVGGGRGALIVLVASAACMVALTEFFAEPSADGRFLRRAVPLLFVGHVIFATGLHLVLVARGTGGGFFDDDIGYANLAALIARSWSGERVAVPTDPSTVHAYVYMAAAIFTAFGPNVLALKLVNVAIGVATGVFGHAIASLLFGARAARVALVGTLIFPSVVLWSSLALKDAFASLLCVVVVWAVTLFQRTRSFGMALVALAALLPLMSTRQYLYMLLLFTFPVALWLDALARRRADVRVPALGTAVSFALVLPTLGVFNVLDLDQMRRNMAEGANTAFVEPTRMVPVEACAEFVVGVPNVTPDPARTPDLVTVPLGATIVFADRPPEAATPPRNSVQVKPDDIVVIAPPEATPTCAPTTRAPRPSVTPTRTPTPEIVVTRTGSSVLVTKGQIAIAGSDRIVRGIAYIPRGLAYFLGAPFPWDIRSPQILALAVDLPIWYPTVVLGFIGAVMLARRRHVDALYPFLVAAGIVGVLSLIEGSLGTLARHRGLAVPLAFVFAAGATAPAMRWLAGRVPAATGVLARIERATAA